MTICNSFRRQPKWLVLTEALLLLGVIGWADFVTGWEWSCFAPYAVPIVLATWKVGRKTGFAFATLCATSYCLADWRENPYDNRLAFALAVAGWWFYFTVLVVAVNALKSSRELDRTHIEALERNRALEEKILQGCEYERQRIGRDLHDGLGPHLAATRYAAALLADELRQRGQPEAPKADEISKLMAEAAALARDIAHAISPVQTNGAGLAVALDELAHTTSRLTGLPVSFYETGNYSQENPVTGMHLYRIAQETVNNAVKHADAKKITIALNLAGDSLRLTIADDGKGMNVSAPDAHGMGLDSMRYRARVLGGELKIDSHPGEGTIISCLVPIQTPRPTTS